MTTFTDWISIPRVKRSAHERVWPRHKIQEEEEGEGSGLFTELEKAQLPCTPRGGCGTNESRYGANSVPNVEYSSHVGTDFTG